MTKNEIDHALALVIGYAPGDIGISSDGVHVWHEGKSRIFDHTDPAVIWPIAEQFDCFPSKHINGGFCAHFWSDGLDAAMHRVFFYSPAAATATALAVIEHCKKGQP